MSSVQDIHESLNRQIRRLLERAVDCLLLSVGDEESLEDAGFLLEMIEKLSRGGSRIGFYDHHTPPLSKPAEVITPMEWDRMGDVCLRWLGVDGVFSQLLLMKTLVQFSSDPLLESSARRSLPHTDSHRVPLIQS